MSIRIRSDDGNYQNKSCDVKHCFPSSTNAAIIERKKLQYTTISTKLHQCTLSQKKTQVFKLSDVLACLSKHCTDQKEHSNPDFSTKSVNMTLQTCVDIENEYLQAYKRRHKR